MATPIQSLKAHQFYEYIIIRHCKDWPDNHYRTGRLISHDYLLVDEEVRIYV